jgi:hypothetical protein
MLIHEYSFTDKEEKEILLFIYLFCYKRAEFVKACLRL